MRQLACALLAAGLAETIGARQQTPKDDVFAPDSRPAVTLRFQLRDDAASDRERLVPTTHTALKWFNEWFGAFPHASLTVIDLPWNADQAGATEPGVVATRTRWLAPARDLTAERALIAGIGRQYWTGPGTAPSFQEALALYSGTRGIHETLEGRNLATERYFGGFVPFVSRSIMWSPSPRQGRPRMRQFAEVGAPASEEVQRAALALHTLERYLGWPAFQPALAELYERRAESGLTPQALADVLGRQRGVDLRWFFAEAFRPGARFDYAVEGLSSEASATDPARFRTVVAVRRLGDGVFAGTSATGDGVINGSLPVQVRFADGAEIVDYWDGRESSASLVYESRARAVSATIDPDLMLLLDVDRRNNSRSLQPADNPLGMRLVLHWVAWLQDVMLSSTALA